MEMRVHHQSSKREGERAVMERRLYEASLSGNVLSLNELMEKNELILDKISVTCFDETPLHVAAMRGHVDFAKAILSRKPKLATELDSDGYSPLHLASAEGYVDIVRDLLLQGTDLCLARDQDGRTPLHLAAAKGRVDVIKELVQARPEVTRVTVDRGETVLHLCVKHNRLEALKLLVESENDDEFVNSKDDDGNTILHLATAKKQIETVKYLLTRIHEGQVNALNGNNFTALDVIEHCPRDLKCMEIREFLREAGALRARYVPPITCNPDGIIKGSEISPVAARSEAVAPPVVHQSETPPPSRGSSWNDDCFKDKRATLMIAATVIAGMGFQAGINPPGGVWNEDDEGNNARRAGTPILAEKQPAIFAVVMFFNTLSFITSLSILLLLAGGLPRKRRFCLRILVAAMWVTVTCMALAYLFSMMATDNNSTSYNYIIAVFSLLAWLGFVGIVFLVHTVRFAIRMWRKLQNGEENKNLSCVKENQGNEEMVITMKAG
ncbi:hypothetical protein HHK36_013852 [Tetracentron sinense]|uniref:PGG domain-containing protein n=1 Tax=Tetracentron sinense TaxID=13715 RepID=A0A834Z8W0_TETSI|nr:hypothetical protein HHK36_013852 [Tetracentron sinense]